MPRDHSFELNNSICVQYLSSVDTLMGSQVRGILFSSDHQSSPVYHFADTRMIRQHGEEVPVEKSKAVICFCS